MGRPKGSKNKPKGEQKSAKPAAAAPSAGHNSGLSEDEQRSLLLKGVERIEELKKEQDSITGKIRNQRQSLKAAGFERYEVDFALELRKKKQGESHEEWQRKQRIARMLNHPIGAPDLFDNSNSEAIENKAFEEGKAAGLAGKPANPEPQYHTGSELGQAWLRGHGEGQAVHLATLGRGDPNTPRLIKGDKPKPADDAFAEVGDEAPGQDGPMTAEAQPNGEATGGDEAGAEGNDEEVEVETVPARKAPRFAAAGDAFLAKQIAEKEENKPAA